MEYKKESNVVVPHSNYYIAADFGLDRPETCTANNLCYFRSKMGVKHYNMTVNGTRLVPVWSGLHGGKAVEEQIKCYEFVFDEYCIAANRIFLCVDGALIGFYMLMFMAWTCHPKNPNRRCTSVHVVTLEQGHSYHEPDNIDAQTGKHYKKRDKWRTCKERVDFINKETALRMVQFTEFNQVPSFFKVIFKDPDKWMDHNANRMLIRDDKPLTYEFGGSEVWRDGEFQWVDHHDELWCRVDEDFKTPCRRIEIFKESFVSLVSFSFRL